METLLSWIAYFLAAVLFAACVVAWYEHLGRVRRPQDEPDWESPMPRAVKVDVVLEPPQEQAATSDQDTRRRTLNGALERMSDGDRRARFSDTTPMILPGKADEVPRADRRRRDETPAA